MNEPKSFQAIIEYFKQKGWRYTVDEGRPILRAEFGCKSGPFRLVAVVEPSYELLQVLTLLPVTVPDLRRVAVAELVTRASWGLKIGKFEMDLAHGEPRLHASCPYAKGSLPDSVIATMIAVSLSMVDLHFPAFMSVIYGDVLPAEALQQARMDMGVAFLHRQPQEPVPANRLRFN